MNEKYLKLTNEDQFDSDKCANILKFSTRRACRTTQFRPWYKDLGLPKSVIGLCLGLIGLFFLFLGAKYFDYTSMIIIGACSGLIIKSFLDPFIKIEFYICFILGIIVAYIVFLMKQIITYVVAVIIGYFLGNMVHTYLVKILTGINPNTLYIIILIVCILAAMYITSKIEKAIQIFATSFIGAYIAIRGLSINLGGFPDESYTSKLILYREFNQLGRAFSGTNMYLLGILLLFILGLFVQGGIHIFSGEEINSTSNQQLNKENENQELLSKQKTTVTS